MDGPWFENKESSLPSDPSVCCGVLPNGMRYVFQPNSYPHNRVHAWLEVNTGSVAETDAEQGLAHWLEHCVFLSTDAFPEVDDLRGKLTSLGMSYGADSNAYTDYTVTCYTLEAPYAAAPGICEELTDSSLPGLLHILHELVFRARLGRPESARGRRLRGSACTAGAALKISAPAVTGISSSGSPVSDLCAAIEREKLAVLSEAAMRNDVDVSKLNTR